MIFLKSILIIDAVYILNSSYKVTVVASICVFFTAKPRVQVSRYNITCVSTDCSATSSPLCKYTVYKSLVGKIQKCTSKEHIFYVILLFVEPPSKSGYLGVRNSQRKCTFSLISASADSALSLRVTDTQVTGFAWWLHIH